MDESDCLSMVSSHDQETERFLSTGPTGRRVSFNEAALFDHGKKAQEKGRRSARQAPPRTVFLFPLDAPVVTKCFNRWKDVNVSAPECFMGHFREKGYLLNNV